MQKLEQFQIAKVSEMIHSGNSGENRVLCRCKKKKKLNQLIVTDVVAFTFTFTFISVFHHICCLLFFITLSCFVVVAFGHRSQLGLLAAMSFLFT